VFVKESFAAQPNRKIFAILRKKTFLPQALSSLKVHNQKISEFKRTAFQHSSNTIFGNLHPLSSMLFPFSRLQRVLACLHFENVFLFSLAGI